MQSTQGRSSFMFLTRFLRPYGRIVFLTVLFLCMAAATILFFGQGLKVLVDQGFSTTNPDFLNQAFISLLVLVALLSFASFARSYLSSWLGEKISNDIKTFVFQNLLSRSPDFYQKHSVGMLQSQLHSDTQMIQVLLGGSASTGLRSVIQFMGAMVMLFISNMTLASLACLIMPMTLLPLVVFGRKVRQTAKIAQEADGLVAEYSNESMTAVQTLQAYGRQAESLEKFTRLSRDALGKANKRILAQSCLSTAVIFLVFAAVSGLMWYGGHDVISGQITSGELISFIFYAVLAAGSINSLSQVFGDWQRAMAACSRLEDLTYEPVCGQVDTIALPAQAVGQITFQNVDFSYPGARNEPVLSHFNLRIERGETVALVGASGAGKSTVFNLLMGFYNPDNGVVAVEGIDLKKMDLGSLRGAIGWVPQDPIIFKDSVYDNIRMSRPDASNEMVRAAAKSAYAEDFINHLPDGFETMLGVDGVGLSSGQKQRIAIARAILKDPAILLLDEATNSLDSESEYHVQKAIELLMQGRTTLIVAHRLSTVLNADRIIVMDQGAIVAMGRHNDLINTSPVYKRFVELQFAPEGHAQQAIGY